MRTLLKQASRAALHNAGGLEFLIRRNRNRIAIVTFHHFGSDPASVEELDRRCEWIRRHFTPVTLDQIADAFDGKGSLPENPVTITVDDGYGDFLVAHPIFRKHGLKATVFLVSGFLDGECWLWVDAVNTLLAQSTRPEVATGINGLVTPLGTEEQRKAAGRELIEAAKRLPDDERRAFLERLPALCGVALPDSIPEKSRPLTWDEVRKLKSEGVSFGAHTHTHPILSRITDPARLADEIRQPKERVIAEAGECNHFCYPNGGPSDIGDAAVQEVEAAGYRTAVTTSVGLNDRMSSRYRLQRLSTETESSRTYFYERLAGLHAGGSAAE
jgi:peptidoglycan/xylan/chitin deacetylase (PgdA/CDA1 family)